jgi:hypothetical protein
MLKPAGQNFDCSIGVRKIKAHRIVRRHIVFKCLWQQQGLRTVMACDVRHDAMLQRWPRRRNLFRSSFPRVCSISDQNLSRSTAEARMFRSS